MKLATVLTTCRLLQESRGIATQLSIGRIPARRAASGSAQECSWPERMLRTIALQCPAVQASVPNRIYAIDNLCNQQHAMNRTFRQAYLRCDGPERCTARAH